MRNSLVRLSPLPTGLSMDQAMATLRGLGVGIGDAITKDGDGETGVVGIVRDEGREGFERNVDGEIVVGEIDVGEREFAVKCAEASARGRARWRNQGRLALHKEVDSGLRERGRRAWRCRLAPR